MKYLTICVLFSQLWVSTSSPALAEETFEAIETDTRLCDELYQLTGWIHSEAEDPPTGCERIPNTMYGNLKVLGKLPVGKQVYELFSFTYILNGTAVTRVGFRPPGTLT